MTSGFVRGHKTMMDGTHVALSEDEATAIWQAVEAERAKRAEAMPRARDALSAFIAVEARLHELGWWKGGGLHVRRGDVCAVMQFGSTGCWTGHVDDDGKYVTFADCVSKPSDVWLKPLADLTDDERQWMEECDRNEREAYSAMLGRFAVAESSP